MPEQYLSADQVLLASVQAARGTEETLAAASDAAKVADLRFGLNLGVDAADDEHTNSLDRGEPVVLGGNAGITFGVRLKGSGAAATPPEWGKFVRGCGFAEDILAVAETGTAQAGAAQSITLAAGASVVDGIFIARKITLTGGTGSGQVNWGIAYDGTSKVMLVVQPWSTPPDATTLYDIAVSVRYSPVSADLEVLTLHGFQNANEASVNSRRRRIFDAMGSFTGELGSRTVPRFNFSFTGKLPAVPNNEARPTGAVFDLTVAPAYRGATSLVGGVAVKFQTVSFDSGNQVATPEDPAETFGVGLASITARNITGRIVPYQKLASTHDFISDFVNQTGRSLLFSWGSVAGEQLSILVPNARYNGNPDEQAIEGFAAEGVSFKGEGPDDSLYLVAY